MKSSERRASLSSSPMHLLHRAEQCASAVFETRMRELDLELTPRQFVILHAIHATAGASQTMLVEATGIDRSTLSEIMARLARRGLIQRRRTGRDRRAYSVSLTVAGRQVLDKAAPSITRIETELLAALPATRRTAFVTALDDIVRDLSTPVPAHGAE